MTQYVAGYTRKHARAGYEPVVACPFTDAKLAALLLDLGGRASAETKPIGRVVVQRCVTRRCCASSTVRQVA